ncbi:unnamed protein product, partial [Nesidiocoris tenuis]
MFFFPQNISPKLPGSTTEYRWKIRRSEIWIGFSAIRPNRRKTVEPKSVKYERPISICEGVGARRKRKKRQIHSRNAEA